MSVWDLRAYKLEYLSFDVHIGSTQDFENVYLSKAKEEIENERHRKKMERN